MWCVTEAKSYLGFENIYEQDIFLFEEYPLRGIEIDKAQCNLIDSFLKSLKLSYANQPRLLFKNTFILRLNMVNRPKDSFRNTNFLLHSSFEEILQYTHW